MESYEEISKCDSEPDEEEEEVTNFAYALETAIVEHEEACNEENLNISPYVVHTMQFPICRVICK